MCFGWSKKLSYRNTSFECLKHNFTIESKQAKLRFLCLKGPLSRWFFSAPKSYVFAEIKEMLPVQSSHQRPASDMPSQWPIAGGLLMARRCLLAGWRPYDNRAIKQRQYFVSKMVRQLTFIFIVINYVVTRI